uniref:rhomboid protease n=1 Tax=Ciona savignyi TaxID=51511 RepID=H2ZDD2_CIOSA
MPAHTWGKRALPSCLQWKIGFVRYPSCSQQCYYSRLQKARAPSSTVCERKPNLRLCFAERIRKPPSTQRFLSYSSFYLNSATAPPKLFISTYLLNSRASMNQSILRPVGSQVLSVRQFHVKEGKSIEDDPKAQSITKLKKSSHHQQDSSKFGLLLGYGFGTALAAALIFGPLAVLDDELSKMMDEVSLQSNIQSMSSLMYIMPILLTNAAVFLLWKRSPKLLTKYFTLSALPGKRNFPSLLWSAFSHKGFIHLCVNMYVLTSFSAAWQMYAKHSTSPRSPGREVLASEQSNYLYPFYISAAVVSGFGSFAIKLIGGISIPSLGASGAIMGLIGYICTKVPESRISIVFLPNWSFTADSAIKGIALFDAAGLLIGAFTKWRYTVIDHAGHLAGLLFGIWYAKSGSQLLSAWHRYCRKKIVGSPRPR